MCNLQHRCAEGLHSESGSNQHEALPYATTSSQYNLIIISLQTTDILETHILSVQIIEMYTPLEEIKEKFFYEKKNLPCNVRK